MPQEDHFSDASADSDIPDEHMNGYNHNEYTRRYNLNIKSNTWNKDSQGLYDFETSHLKKAKYVTNKESTLVRYNTDVCAVEGEGVNLIEKYGLNCQKLLNVKKFRNSYLIESPDVEAMEKMNPVEKKAYMTRDVD